MDSRCKFLTNDNADCIYAVSKISKNCKLLNFQQGTYAIPASANGEITSGLPSGTSGAVTSSGGTGGAVASDEMHSPPGPDDDEESMDWWTKYFASVDAMIEVINQRA